jgi:hypothetical protein
MGRKTEGCCGGYAALHVAQSCEEIKIAYKAGAVDEVCEKWLAERPAIIAQQLISEVLNAR